MRNTHKGIYNIYISFIVLSVFLAGCLPAEEPKAKGEEEEPSYCDVTEGDGETISSPLAIGDADELKNKLITNFSDNKDKHFVLTKSIELDSNYTKSIKKSFTGSFDGCENTITGNSKTIQGSGFFAKLERTIKNLTLENISVTGEDTNEHVGGLAGKTEKDSKIINVGVISGDSSTVTIKNTKNNGGANVGGLVGDNYAEIKRSYATVTVEATGTPTADKRINIGGLVGQNGTNSITNCYAAGTITAESTTTTTKGGLIGKNSSRTNKGNYWKTQTGIAKGIGGSNDENSATDEGAESKPETDFKNGERFRGWKSARWTFTKDSYPKLAWEAKRDEKAKTSETEISGETES